jgi:hypothetical protein
MCCCAYAAELFSLHAATCCDCLDKLQRLPLLMRLYRRIALCLAALHRTVQV